MSLNKIAFSKTSGSYPLPKWQRKLSRHSLPSLTLFLFSLIRPSLGFSSLVHLTFSSSSLQMGKRLRGKLIACQDMQGGSPKTGPFFAVVNDRRTRDNMSKLRKVKFSIDIGREILEKSVKHWKRLMRETVCSSSEMQLGGALSWSGLLADPALDRRLDQWPPEVPSSPSNFLLSLFSPLFSLSSPPISGTIPSWWIISLAQFQLNIPTRTCVLLLT